MAVLSLNRRVAAPIGKARGESSRRCYRAPTQWVDMGAVMLMLVML